MDKILFSNIASEKFNNYSTEEKNSISKAIDKYLFHFEEYKNNINYFKQIDSDFYKLRISPNISLIINFSDELTSITDIENKSIEKKVALDTEYGGSIPSPEILKEYEKIEPGSVARILEMAAKESAHRRELEKNLYLKVERRNSVVQIFVVLISIVFTSIGIFMSISYTDKTIQSIILIAIGGLPLLAGFISIFAKWKK